MKVLAIAANNYQLLLPISMVAQIVGLDTINRSPDIQHEHLAGLVTWRGYDIPLIRSSELTGQRLNADQEFERIVILWPMKSASNRSFLALTSMTAPRVIEIDREQLISTKTRIPYSQGVVQLDDAGFGIIPDIARLAAEIYPPGITPPTG